MTLSPDSRSTAWMSFDGRTPQVELTRGDSLLVTLSKHPLPTVCAQDPVSDWFSSLADCLNWNDRKKQKAMPDP